MFFVAFLSAHVHAFIDIYTVKSELLQVDHDPRFGNFDL